MFCNDKVGRISFPFVESNFFGCKGLYPVDCSNLSNPKIQLKDGGYWYRLESITRSSSFVINDSNLQGLLERQNCNDDVFDLLSLSNRSSVAKIYITNNLTLFRCNNIKPYNPPYRGPNYACSSSLYTYYTSSQDSLKCSTIHIPIREGFPPNLYDPSELTAQFSLQVQVSKECYRCYDKNGHCSDNDGEFKCSDYHPRKVIKSYENEAMINFSVWDFILYSKFLTSIQDHYFVAIFALANDKYLFAFNVAGDQNLRLKLGLGTVLAVALMITSCCLFWKKRQQNCQNAEAFLRNYGPLQVKRYSYWDVKKMTNSFKKKLGQGGFGSVYKGKLKDGRLVAVKVLSRTKGNGEEFMNEVAAISRTSHVNIVSLLGFCFEGSKRALIYEFMPNGSLEKFIFDANNPQKDRQLGWETLYRISLGIARGLEYLHRGCNTRILHFDIKPHNILLDENLRPKISDFGLAKICDRTDSIVSLFGARGTVGYIAPEVFCRNFGRVSHKSDLYSYGMMLSEMAGGRRNINVEVENTSEIYFPHWIYKRLELDQELGLRSIMNEEDKVRARKMIIVSLWCIQTDPSNRPAIREVIEMLEGSVDSLQMPPKPFLSSPPKSPAMVDSSTTSVPIQ
ncbi:hypothetical protein M0R45_006314 [Rubus argutus]|uniref:Protein kinase domain-containing protein n=1 Tax=Rubus argutus TaxID=59490 RepID=A0AAW1YQL1_RUBAR